MSKTTASSEKVSISKIKTFKNSEKMEAFYRYIHENGLREEALGLLKYALSSQYPARNRGRKGKILQ